MNPLLCLIGRFYTASKDKLNETHCFTLRIHGTSPTESVHKEKCQMPRRFVAAGASVNSSLWRSTAHWAVLSRKVCCGVETLAPFLSTSTSTGMEAPPSSDRSCPSLQNVMPQKSGCSCQPWSPLPKHHPPPASLTGAHLMQCNESVQFHLTKQSLFQGSFRSSNSQRLRLKHNEMIDAVHFQFSSFQRY